MEDRQNVGILSDEQIVELYFDREENAIKETNKKHGKYLYTIAFNILNNNEDSEECLNDTYLKTWHSIPPTMPIIFRAFLAKIMRGTALDRYDEARRQKRIPAEMFDSLSDFEGFIADTTDANTEIEAKEIGRIITEYLDSSSDRKIYIFMSRYFFVMPIAEIAKKLGCSESTVNKELCSIKRELRKKFEDEGIEI